VNRRISGRKFRGKKSIAVKGLERKKKQKERGSKEPRKIHADDATLESEREEENEAEGKRQAGGGRVSGGASVERTKKRSQGEPPRRRRP